MNKEDLEKLKSRLPKNYGQIIHDSLKSDKTYSPTYIHLVLNGKANNDDIVRAAILVAEQHEEDKMNLGKAARGEEKLDKVKFKLLES